MRTAQLILLPPSRAPRVPCLLFFVSVFCFLIFETWNSDENFNLKFKFSTKNPLRSFSASEDISLSSSTWRSFGIFFGGGTGGMGWNDYNLFSDVIGFLLLLLSTLRNPMRLARFGKRRTPEKFGKFEVIYLVRIAGLSGHAENPKLHGCVAGPNTQTKIVPTRQTTIKTFSKNNSRTWREGVGGGCWAGMGGWGKWKMFGLMGVEIACRNKFNILLFILAISDGKEMTARKKKFGKHNPPKKN